MTLSGVDLERHLESVVVRAEKEFYAGRQSVAREFVEDFLRRTSQKDQYYCRANALMGLLIDHEAKGSYGSESILKRKSALSQMIIAVDVATAPQNVPKYNFVVYDTSLLFWDIIRPFLTVGRAKYFSAEVCRMSAALEKCDDTDMAWRIMYLSAAAFCFFDR